LARFAAGWRTAAAGSTTLPMASLIGATTVRPRIVEVGVFNTTANAFGVALRRCTALGGTHAGAASAVQKESDTAQANLATVLDADTGTAPTLTSGQVRTASLGAAIGSGVIWTFGPLGLVIPDTANNGVVIIGYQGTAQICDIYFVWDE
jgi:hypothetical protein